MSSEVKASPVPHSISLFLQNSSPTTLTNTFRIGREMAVRSFCTTEPIVNVFFINNMVVPHGTQIPYP